MLPSSHNAEERSQRHTLLYYPGTLNPHGLPWGLRPPHTDLPRSPGTTCTLLYPGRSLPLTLLCQVVPSHCTVLWIQPLLPLQILAQNPPCSTHCSMDGYFLLYTLHQWLPTPLSAHRGRHPPFLCHKLPEMSDSLLPLYQRRLTTPRSCSTPGTFLLHSVLRGYLLHTQLCVICALLPRCSTKG